VVYPQNTPPAFPRLEPDPKALEYYRLGRQNSGYSWTELAEISLWASTGEPSLTGMERIRAAVETLKNSPNLPASDREKAEFILDFMHSNFLRSYSLYQTRVDTIFTNGRFNCVSSAVLYVILCESSGINTSGVITRDHALVTVHVNGEDIDVETTNRYGFDPGSRKDFHDQFGRLTGFTYVPARNYRDRQTIGKIELISLILNNRIAELERANRYAEAVPLAVDRTALLFGDALAVNTAENASASLFEDPRKNLMDRLLNYGAALLRANREEDCLNWTVIASSRFPDIERWQELSMAAVNNRIARFIREGRTGDARNFLESHRTLLTDSGYAQLNGVLLDSELLRRANQISAAADGEAVVSAIEQARNSGALAERRAGELITFAVLKTASLYAPARNWREAIRYLESVLARFGANRDIEQALQTYMGNLAADYHNRFAAEWNRRNYDEAERILNEALTEFPNNRQLLSDRETVNRRRN
jgi:tetratricopeptide (TPR) repeat protein